MANPVGSLADPFNTAALNTAMWTQTTGGTTTMSYATTGASVVLPASATAADMGRIVSGSTYDLTGSSVAIHLISVFSSSAGADALFGLCATNDIANGASYVRFATEGPNLMGQYNQAGTGGVAFTTSFSSSTHAYWRISESAGTATWWTSSDGVAWTSQGTHAHNLTTPYVCIEGYCWKAETSAGTFKFNLLNGRSLRPLPVCKQQAVNRSYTY